MRAAALAALCLTVAARTLAQTSTQTAPADTRAKPTFVDPRGTYGLTPPAGLRMLTPDEARDLRARAGSTIPAELLEPQPPRIVVFGAIDRWLAGAYDGRALAVLEIDGEPSLDDAGLAGIRAHFAEMSRQGEEPIAVEDLRLGQAGPAAHPAILATLRLGAANAPRLRFDAYLPTGGVTITLAMSWPADDRSAGAMAFAELLTGVHVAAAPRGSANLGRKLMWAGLCGLGIGVLLHSLRKRAAT